MQFFWMLDGGPHRPDHWTSEVGTNYRVGTSPASAVIIGMAFKDRVSDLAWSRAAGHFMGPGLEQGPQTIASLTR